MYFSSAPVCLSICVCVSVRAKTVYKMLVLSRSSINSTLSIVDTGVMTSSTVVPRFSIEPQSSVVRTGSAVALTCAVEPQTASIRWALNGSTISPQAARRRGIELTRDGQLLISAFNHLSSSSSSSVSATAGRVRHDGVYQCAAVTQAGVIVSSEAKLQTACTLRLFSISYDYLTLSVPHFTD